MPAIAIEVCQRLIDVRPMFVEEPVPQENVDALKLVSDHVPFPIATGERLLSRWEFRTVLEKGACAYLQPDVAHAGGISELRRIANMAEVYYVHLMPHCAIGPVALTACLHVDAAIPKFLIQESIGPDWLTDVAQPAWKVVDGFAELPTVPGLGIEVDEKEASKMAAWTEELGGEWYYPQDGSVADW
jgi:galactonate dehydratase